MCLLKIGSELPLGKVVSITNAGGVYIHLDYYGKIHAYTTTEIEGML
jgi:hypothetical protein